MQPVARDMMQKNNYNGFAQVLIHEGCDQSVFSTWVYPGHGELAV